MHAFLYSQDPPTPASPDTLHVYPDPSIGIDAVRQIQLFLTRKPIQSAVNSVIIHQAHLLSLPAQNALLKSLEEPPGESRIFLVTLHPHSLLPTVLSRLQQTHQNSPPSPPPDFQLITQLLHSGVGDRIIILESQSLTRASAHELLNQLELFIHSQVTSGHPFPTARLYDILDQTRQLLLANCHLKHILTNLALHLQSPR